MKYYPLFKNKMHYLLLRALARSRWDFLRDMGTEWLEESFELLRFHEAGLYGELTYLTRPPFQMPEVKRIEDAQLDYPVALIDDLLINPTPFILQELASSFSGYVLQRLVQLAIRYSNAERLEEAFRLVAQDQSMVPFFLPLFDNLLPFFNRLDQMPLMEEYYCRIVPKYLLPMDFCRTIQYHKVSPIALLFLQQQFKSEWTTFFNGLPIYLRVNHTLNWDDAQCLADLLVSLNYDPLDDTDFSYFILSLTGRWNKYPSMTFIWYHFARNPELLQHSAGFIHTLLQSGLLDKTDVFEVAQRDAKFAPLLYQVGFDSENYLADIVPKVHYKLATGSLFAPSENDSQFLL